MNLSYKSKKFYAFKQYFIFLIFYSIGGWFLERIINLLFLGEWYDNSVLIGPYQPLYGSGVLLTIIFYNFIHSKFHSWNSVSKEILFVFAAIFFTGFVEAITGWGFEYLYGTHLWDYGDFFPCSLEYVCIIPTSLFGILSYLVVKYVHPMINSQIPRINDLLFFVIFLVFIVDIFITLYTM